MALPTECKKKSVLQIFPFFLLFFISFFLPTFLTSTTRWMDGLSLLLLLCVLKTDFFRFLYYYKLLLLSVSYINVLIWKMWYIEGRKKRNFFNWYCEASFHSVTYTSLSFLLLFCLNKNKNIKFLNRIKKRKLITLFLIF